MWAFNSSVCYQPPLFSLPVVYFKDLWCRHCLWPVQTSSPSQLFSFIFSVSSEGGWIFSLWSIVTADWLILWPGRTTGNDPDLAFRRFLTLLLGKKICMWNNSIRKDKIFYLGSFVHRYFHCLSHSDCVITTRSYDFVLTFLTYFYITTFNFVLLF